MSHPGNGGEDPLANVTHKYTKEVFRDALATVVVWKEFSIPLIPYVCNG